MLFPANLSALLRGKCPDRTVNLMCLETQRDTLCLSTQRVVLKNDPRRDAKRPVFWKQIL